ncbi:MAG: hypothetical protein DRI94_12225 [Bacteroidetes bacterium]|nr:MAG: hypothetical protein DRI94_12225 [Bacteroidota bacterium]
MSLKEANESHYWIELLYKSDYIKKKEYISISNDINEILKILISIIKTSKKNNN